MFSVKCFKVNMICLTLTGQNGPLVCILNVFAVRLMRVPRYYLVSWSDTPRLYNHLPFWDTFMCYEGLSSRFVLSLSPSVPSCLVTVDHNLGNCQDPHVLRLEPSLPVPSCPFCLRGCSGDMATGSDSSEGWDIPRSLLSCSWKPFSLAWSLQRRLRWGKTCPPESGLPEWTRAGPRRILVF